MVALRGEIAYTLTGARASLMRRPADGTGEAVVLVEADGYPFAADWSTDGRYLAYSELTSEAGWDIGYVELQTDGEVSEPVTFLATPTDEALPRCDLSIGCSFGPGAGKLELTNNGEPGETE